ncbi:ribosomal protein S18 acetylase RimI-like enzyme [Fictibacillus barbaricus]|uniref:Ribosomal protein S18 acetylase RimI-like enzyme n=1 Tax=Fictibacillus barbaricus TaxID=182136 RepID=A0ABU1TW38_9BACL|nr:ribosomal protein S18 acetylase RimI-like enzyme [Fictibacillus barbaricus]
MVTYEKMNQTEFQEYMEFMLPDYARDISEHYLIAIEKANEEAEQQMKNLLPDQEKTEGHHLYLIKKDNENAGYLWFHIKKDEKKAFLYHIYILDSFRKQGVAKKALGFFEEEARTEDAASLGLHVFGSNVNAIELYKRLGYEQASISMNKVL